MSEIPLRVPDDDLIPLLRKCNNDELDPLVQYITQKGLLTSQLDITQIYEKHHPNHQMYADEIAAEIQKYGGNTLINPWRKGQGVFYKEIVCDVADRLDVNYNKAREVEFIEMQILLKILEKAWEKMSEEEKRTLMDELGDKAKSSPIPKDFPIMLIQAAIKKAGFKAFAFGLKLALNAANAIYKLIFGTGMSFKVAGNVAKYTANSMKFLAGPIGWAITTIWALSDIAAPAYRVTVPCVIHVAMLRQLHTLKESEENKDK